MFVKTESKENPKSLPFSSGGGGCSVFFRNGVAGAPAGCPYGAFFVSHCHSFLSAGPCVAKSPVFPNSICASYPAARLLPFFARPFFKKAATPRSSAATGPCRSHRVNDTPAPGALPLCSALRLPVSALGFPPHFCPDTTTRPFPLHPAEPAPGAGTGGAPDAGRTGCRRACTASLPCGCAVGPMTFCVRNPIFP